MSWIRCLSKVSVRTAVRIGGLGALGPMRGGDGGEERTTLRARDLLSRKRRELVYSTRYVVNGYPAIYLPLTRVRHRDDGHWIVGPDTELVLEGFARSGNTFAVDAFELAQGRAVKMVHHTHAPAQVLAAADRGIPTLVIVRDPMQVVLSHMAFRDISAGPPLRAWIRYHERILTHAHGIAVATFDEVTTDFGAVIQRVNTRFGTSFEEFEHSEPNQARVFQVIEERNKAKFGGRVGEGTVRSVARPSADREALKQRYRIELASPRLAGLRGRARRLYGMLVAPASDLEA